MFKKTNFGGFQRPSNKLILCKSSNYHLSLHSRAIAEAGQKERCLNFELLSPSFDMKCAIQSV